MASRNHEQEAVTEQVVSEISPAAPFYPAEDYHQRYFDKLGPVTVTLP